MNTHFKFSPSILSRLGEELNPNPEQGLIELVKNAYDADAQKCTVKLINTSEKEGQIIISDDGAGMSIETINNGWFLLGKSKKNVQILTPVFRRLPVGDKGLGRLAALRQGEKVTVRTRPKEAKGWEYVVNIEWERFVNAKTVEEITFPVIKKQTSKKHGTDVILEGLVAPLPKLSIQRLARELVLLSDPFTHEGSFKIELQAEEYSELEELVRDAYFDEAEYRLIANLNKNGIPEVSLFDYKGSLLFKAKDEELLKYKRQLYDCPSLKFEMWVFLLDAKTFSTRKARIKEVKEWLSVVGGVHIYHRGLRVRPYGDPGHDWLDMNLLRAKSPEERPSTNTVIGRITVLDKHEKLIQKTDRSGFIENQEFLEMKCFARDMLQWMAQKRMIIAEKKRQISKVETPKEVNEAKNDLLHLINTYVPQKNRKVFLNGVTKYEKAKGKETSTLRKDLLLYRSVATAGITASVFAHETGKPSRLITRTLKVVVDNGQKWFGEKFNLHLQKPIDLISKSIEAIKQVADLPIKLLNKDKRRSGIIEIHQVINESEELLLPFLNEANIYLDKDLIAEKSSISGTYASVQSIFMNMLTNSINALTILDGAPINDREIKISTENSENNIVIKIMDNGPGIKGLSLEEIWIPGQSTVPNGTGIGLTIVKDSVLELGGVINVLENGKLGGAEFTIKLPFINPN